MSFKCSYRLVDRRYESTAYVDTDEPDTEGRYYGTNKHTDEPVVLLSVDEGGEFNVWQEVAA